MKTRVEIMETLGPLVEATVVPADLEEIRDFLDASAYSRWKLVAPACVMCQWDLKAASSLDDHDDGERNSFVREVRGAVDELLLSLGATLPMAA